MNQCSHTQKEWEKEMDILALLFSELQLTPKEESCVVCGNATKNIIHDVCEKNCKYVCHKKCLDNWITYKGYGVFCMICGLSQNHDYITKVFNESKFFYYA